MAYTLPDALVNFKHKRKRFVFFLEDATVLKASRWSETHVSGSGSNSVSVYNGFGGGGGSMSVDSTVIENNEVWFMLENGREYCYVFSGEQAYIRLREGQKVTLVVAKDKKDKETVCCLINHATQMDYDIERPYHIPMKAWHFWALMAIGALIAIPLWFVMVPILLASWLIRARKKTYAKRFNSHTDELVRLCYAEHGKNVEEFIALPGGVLTQHTPQLAQTSA